MSNQSPLRTGLLSYIEPVSDMPKRKLENGEQRRALEIRRSRTESLEIAEQRLGHVRLTRGNVDGSHTPGNHTEETGLSGWGASFEPGNGGIKIQPFPQPYQRSF